MVIYIDIAKVQVEVVGITSVSIVAVEITFALLLE
jgi:hypothetical protein